MNSGYYGEATAKVSLETALEAWPRSLGGACSVKLPAPLTSMGMKPLNSVINATSFCHNVSLWEELFLGRCASCDTVWPVCLLGGGHIDILRQN